MNDKRHAVHRAVLSTMAEGFVFQDLEGKITDYNDAACRILRVTPDQMEGTSSFDPEWKPIREDGSDFPPKYHPVTVTLNTGDPCYDVVMGIQNNSGHPRWVQVNSQAVIDDETGEQIGAVATFADVTVQVISKNALDKDGADVERALENTRLKLQQLALEFAEPSNSLAADADAVRTYVNDSPAPEHVAKSAERLHAASEKLMRLLTDLGADVDGRGES